MHRMSILTRHKQNKRVRHRSSLGNTLSIQPRHKPAQPKRDALNITLPDANTLFFHTVQFGPVARVSENNNIRRLPSTLHHENIVHGKNVIHRATQLRSIILFPRVHITASIFGIQKMRRRATAIRTSNEQGAPAHMRHPLRKDVDATRVLLVAATRADPVAAKRVFAQTRRERFPAANVLVRHDADTETPETHESSQVGGASLFSRLPPPELVLTEDNIAYERVEAGVDGTKVLLRRDQRKGAVGTGDSHAWQAPDGVGGALPDAVFGTGPFVHLERLDPGLRLRLLGLDYARGPVDEEDSGVVGATHPGVWEMDVTVAAEVDRGLYREIDRRSGERDDVFDRGRGKRLCEAAEIDGRVAAVAKQDVALADQVPLDAQGRSAAGGGGPLLGAGGMRLLGRGADGSAIGASLLAGFWLEDRVWFWSWQEEAKQRIQAGHCGE